METDKLVLRKLSETDIDDLVESGNDYDVHYNSFFLMKFPFGKKEAIEVINEDRKSKNMERFGIELKETGTIIGLIDLYNIKESNPALHSSQNQESFPQMHKKAKIRDDLCEASPAGGKLKLGYWIGRNYRQKGYATEAIKKIIKYAFEKYNVDEIIATTLISNESSMNLLKKLGFAKGKVLKNDRFLDGKYIDSVQFVLKREDYLRNKQA